jgi:hypothetical protein
MRIIIILIAFIAIYCLLKKKEYFKSTKNKNKNKKNCKFPIGCATRKTKGMWYGIRGYPKTYRNALVGSYFHRLFPFFHASSRSPYQVYPNKILSK